MNEYEQRALKEVEEWKRKIQKRSSILNRVSKKRKIK